MQLCYRTVLHLAHSVVQIFCFVVTVQVVAFLTNNTFIVIPACYIKASN